MSEFDRELEQEISYPEMRKGFKGFWWNFFNCGKLSKEDQKKVIKKTLIGGMIAAIVLTALITAGIFAAEGIAQAIENSKPYSQVKIEDFRKNWNKSVAADPDGITEGVNLTKGDVSDGYNILSTENSWIAVSRCGRDFETISYTSEQYRDPKNRAAILTEILNLCMPSIDHTQAVQKYLEYEKKFVQDSIRGFEIHFSEAPNESEIKYNITMEYDLSYKVIEANLIPGCVYDITLNEFIESFNQMATDYWGEGALKDGYWNIENMRINSKGTYELSGTTIYKKSWTLMGKEYATLLVAVDNTSRKISTVEYHALPMYNSETATDNYINKLPSFIFSALGVCNSDYVFSDYFDNVDSEKRFYYYRNGSLARALSQNNLNILSMTAGTKLYAGKMMGDGYTEEEINAFIANNLNKETVTPNDENTEDDTSNAVPEKDSNDTDTTSPNDVETEQEGSTDENEFTDSDTEPTDPSDSNDSEEEQSTNDESTPAPAITYEQYVGTWSGSEDGISYTLTVNSANATSVSGVLSVTNGEQTASVSFQGTIKEDQLIHQYSDDGLGNEGTLYLNFGNNISIANTENSYNYDAVFHWTTYSNVELIKS